MNINIFRLFSTAALLTICFTANAFSEDNTTGRKGYSCWAGMGMFSGDVTYQIGKNYVEPARNIDVNLPFPVSKLEFPLNVNIVKIGNEFTVSDKIDIRGELGRNITTGAGKQQDTDYSFVSRQPTLAYSSNDADVQIVTLDIGFRYWAAKQDIDTMRIKCGIGLAYLYENFNWRLSNLDQTNYFSFTTSGNLLLNNPPTKSAQKGIIGTYQTTTNMPYIELALVEESGPFSGLLSIGYSPFARISDEDNHILRQIYSTTDVTGDAYKIGVQAKYDITGRFFVMGKWDWVSFKLMGTETDIVYDGSDASWTEGHEISSTHSNLSLSFGARF
jgi:outer membrane protease